MNEIIETPNGIYYAKSIEFMSPNEFERRIKIIKETWFVNDFDYLKVHGLEINKL